MKSGRCDLYQCALYDDFPRVLNGQKKLTKFEFLGSIFYPRFSRKKILVASFILSSVGAIGALLLSAKDDDKGEECSVLHFATLTLVSNISDLQPPLRVVTSKTTPGKKKMNICFTFGLHNCLALVIAHVPIGLKTCSSKTCNASIQF